MKRIVLILGMLLLLLPVSLQVTMLAAQDAAPTIDCANVDMTDYNGLIEQANTALSTGDVVTAVQARSDARAMLRNIENQCLMTPIITQMGTETDVKPADLMGMASCEYRFDATVRNGTNKGVYLHGTLGLLQDSDTTATGFVVPDDEKAQTVPVQAELGADLGITLTFTLPDNTTIVGTGTMDTTIAGCFGMMEGSFQGPGADDAGDWISGPVTRQPIDDFAACLARNLPQCTNICAHSSNPNCRTDCTNTVTTACAAN